MKRNFLLLFSAAFLLLQSTAFGHAGQTRTIQPFNRINAGSIFEIVYSYSTETTCMLAGNDKLIELTELTVKEGTLYLTLKQDERNYNGKEIKVILTGPEFTGATISGVASLKVTGDFPKSDIDLTITGVGEFIGKINASSLKGNFAGVTEIVLEGTADKADVTVCGTVDLKAKALEVNEWAISVSGVASAKISVKNKLDAFTSGLAELSYWGTPQSVSKTASGLSEIKQK